VVDPAECVIKAGVIPYVDESSARADWRRMEREALFLNFYADRFGTTVGYEDYASTKRKTAEDDIGWLSHAASESVFGKHAPPHPVVAYEAGGVSAAKFFGPQGGFIAGHLNGMVTEVNYSPRARTHCALCVARRRECC